MNKLLNATQIVATALLACTVAHAEVLQFGSERHCMSSGRVSAELCANAAVNAAAEFEEKAPRFTTREACERVYRSGCAVGFRGESGFRGQRGAVFFSPRQQGFRIVVRSDHDMRVTPGGPNLGFGERTVIRRDTSIHPRASREYKAPSLNAAAATQFGIPVPDAPKGPLPPPPPVDPNFDCAAFLEPGSDPTAGCALAPIHRR